MASKKKQKKEKKVDNAYGKRFSRYLLRIGALALLTWVLGHSIFNREMDLSTLFQLTATFLTISLIIPSLVLTLGVPYFLSLYNTLYDQLYYMSREDKENNNQSKALKKCASEAIERVESFRGKTMPFLTLVAGYSFLGAIIGFLVFLGMYRWLGCIQKCGGIVTWWLGIEIGMLSIGLVRGFKYYPVRTLIKLRRMRIGESKLRSWEGTKEE